MINRTNIALSIVLIGILSILFYVDIDFSTTFIYPIAGQVVEHQALIGILLVGFAAFGLGYRNKKTYFKSYKKVVCSVGYICALSDCITLESIASGCAFEDDIFRNIGVIVLCGCEILMILLMPFDKPAKSKQVENTTHNPFDPIQESDKLFNSRQNQADIFIDMVKSPANDNGYSICINGEWGTGKTSFINSVLDIMDRQKINYEEIRINSMELDSFESLVNYFFCSIKDILKRNDVYVGVESEYKELVSSLVGTVIHESAGGFLSGLFSTNPNYRENLQKLGKLLKEQLKKVKILVIVDDLERCGKNDNKSGMNYLFFIKEIATLNHCICVFLLNYDEFLNIYEIESSFFDRFFNERINLSIPSATEVLGNIISGGADIENLYKSSKIEFEEYINRFQNQVKTNDENYKKVINQYENYIHTFTNPRKAGLFSGKFKELENIIKQQETDGNKENYNAFLTKVNFHEQIFILALLYSSYPREYEQIEIKGFTAYIDSFLSLNDIEANVRNWFVYKAWCVGKPKGNTFLLSEKICFVDKLLSSPKELPNISNGFTTLQEKYINNLLHHYKPENVLFDDILTNLLMANIDNSDSDKVNIITKCIDEAFSLYKNDVTFDEVIQCLESKTLVRATASHNCYFNSIFRQIAILNIVNPQKCIESFRQFAQNYIMNKTSEINNYIIICGSHFDQADIIYIRESILSGNNCEKMIEKYCTEFVKRFKLHVTLPNDPFDQLNTLINKADAVYNNNSMSIYQDVIENKISAQNAVDCIRKLVEIEKLISSDNTKTHQEQNVIVNMSYSELIDKINNELDSYPENGIASYVISNHIDCLFDTIAFKSQNIDEDGKETINKIIEKYHSKTNLPSVNMRNRFIEVIESQSEKHSNTQPIL